MRRAVHSCCARFAPPPNFPAMSFRASLRYAPRKPSLSRGAGTALRPRSLQRAPPGTKICMPFATPRVSPVDSSPIFFPSSSVTPRCPSSRGAPRFRCGDSRARTASCPTCRQRTRGATRAGKALGYKAGHPTTPAPCAAEPAAGCGSAAAPSPPQGCALSRLPPLCRMPVTGPGPQILAGNPFWTRFKLASGCKP